MCVIEASSKDQVASWFKKMGMPFNKIADETVAQTEEDVLAYMQKVNHPALTLAPVF